MTRKYDYGEKHEKCFFQSILGKGFIMSRKEVFQHEIMSGATIEEVKIYTNSLRLILSALSGREYTIVNSQYVFTEYSILSKEEQETLFNEIKELESKIKVYEKAVKKI